MFVQLVEPEQVSFDRCTDRELVATGEELAAAQRALDVAKVRLLAEVDARGVAAREEALTTPTWWSRVEGLPVGVARRRVRHAVLLASRFPKLIEALDDGRLSWAQVEVILGEVNHRTVDGFASVQEHLPGLAEWSTFPAFRSKVRLLAERIDPDGGHRPEPDDSRLQFASTFGGSVRVTGVLHGHHADLVRAAIEVRTDEVARAYRRRCREESRPAGRTRSQHRAAALAELMREATTVEVHLVVPAGSAQRHLPARTLDGRPLTRDTASGLPALADRWRTTTVDDDGLPLDVGRAKRFATMAQHIALWIRDGGCVFPGCPSPAHHCDAHHVEFWSDGGRTDLATLAGVCGRHHDLVHRSGWEVELDSRQRAVVTRGDGRRRWGQRHGEIVSPRPPPPLE